MHAREAVPFIPPSINPLKDQQASCPTQQTMPTALMNDGDEDPTSQGQQPPTHETLIGDPTAS